MSDATRRHPGATGLFSCWGRAGFAEFNPHPPTPEEAKPFHVALYNEHTIPGSLLVFALDAGHALARVRAALIQTADARASTSPTHDMFGEPYPNYAQELLRRLDDGSLTMTAEPVDTSRIVAHVNWAANGGVCH